MNNKNILTGALIATALILTGCIHTHAPAMQTNASKECHTMDLEMANNTSTHNHTKHMQICHEAMNESKKTNGSMNMSTS